ncbi:cupin domain-containing protein [Verrucomicrobium spinosum]|uniref:cupin domain-containing protein n=1 Tax=Verrucomicrobium spinosum TaxID=2736 RepID=UPI00017443B8|nr:cupin domain-containing protein [Verrucomicrobium spinosum]
MPALSPSSSETFTFDDDGLIPNSPLPLLLYRDVVRLAANAGQDLAKVFEEQFAINQWSGSWRNGVYPYHHYHSNTHEVLGVYRGSATLKLGGSTGHETLVQAGDVIIIPAGVGHMCIEHSHDFSVVGAYPNGMKCDILTGELCQRPQALERVKQVPVPDFDPVLGKEGGLRKWWPAD